MFKRQLAVCDAVLLGCGAVPVTADDAKGNVVVQFAGERRWSAECTVSKSNGREQTVRRRVRGNNSLESIGIRSVTGGSCVVSVPEEGKVKVTFTSTGSIACPFENSELCIESFLTVGDHTFSFLSLN